jgi:hypothetical protein
MADLSKSKKMSFNGDSLPAVAGCCAEGAPAAGGSWIGADDFTTSSD